MRKKVWMALAGCVILGLSGCGSTASDTAQEVQDSASEDTEEEASEKASWYGTRVVTETKAAEVISSEDQDFFGDTFFVTDTGELWIYQEGVFFRTEKAE